MTYPDSMGGFVVDASALTELAQPNVYAATFVDQAAMRGMVLLVPTAALSEAWQTIRTSGASAEAMSMFLTGPTLLIEPLDQEGAQRAGELVADRRVIPDVAAAHVATACRKRGWPALSTSPTRLLAVDPAISVAKLPGT